MNRMLFSNNPNYNGLRLNVAPTQVSKSVSTNTTSNALNAKMIDRVHKAKPGCSACGKRVM